MTNAFQPKIIEIVKEGPQGPAIGDMRGAWVAGTYNRRSIVEHNGSLWLALRVTSQEPSIGIDWQLLVSGETVATESLRADLSSTTDPVKGAGGVGYDPAQPYAGSSNIGAALNLIFNAVATNSVASMLVPTWAQFIHTAGYYTAGDGGACRWRVVTSLPSHTCYKALAGGGRWIVPDEPILTAKQLGLRGDGSTVDNTAMIAALTFRKYIAFEDGVYVISNIVLPTGACLASITPRAATLKLNPAAGTGLPMLQRTGSDGASTYAYFDISLNGLVIDGGNRTEAQTGAQGLIQLRDIDGLFVDGCVFKNHPYILLSQLGVKNSRISRCDFYNWGKPTAGAEGGAAIFANRLTTDSTEMLNYTISGCNFYGGEWAAIYSFGYGGLIHDCKFNGIKEAAIYAQNGVGPTNRMILSMIQVDGVTLKTIQACGIEIGGLDVEILHPIIANCVGAGIVLTDPSVRTVITNPIFTNNCSAAPVAADGQISIRTTDNTTTTPHDIQIRGGIIRDTRSTKLARAAISLYGVDGENPLNNITIDGVDVRGGGLTPIYLEPNAQAIGANVVIRNCPGYNDANAIPTTGHWLRDTEVRMTDRAAGDPLGWICTLEGMLGAPAWAATTAIAVGDFVSNDNKVYRCTTAGVTGASGPTHTSVGGVVDGTATLVYHGPIATFSPFGVVGRPTITGSRGDNEALASLLSALEAQGGIYNGTTA